jgi:hypothetical protein
MSKFTNGEIKSEAGKEECTEEMLWAVVTDLQERVKRLERRVLGE